jgi:DNA-binding NtrC family response regulator
MAPHDVPWRSTAREADRMTLVLLIDDVRPMAEQYAYDLRRLGGYDTLVAGDGREGLELLAREPVDCVILDLEMPGMDGFAVIRAMVQRGSEVPAIVYTGTGDFERCVQAVRLGAAGFIDKAEPMERVVQEVAGAVERRRLRLEVSTLQRRLGETSIVGGSPAILRLREAIARVAPIPSTVLILGESGSGKELVARDLHRLGANPAGPFVAINAAALPEHLVESELFGHERGAFTGAAAARAGAFEAAGGGTLFLDEIGELPLAQQAKLLRVLEERQVTRLGASRPRPVEARVVAATNRDLEEEIAAGRFRQDLYYRLNVHLLAVPPLRERRSDIPALAERFIAAICGRFGVLPKRLSGDAVDRLMVHEWRRNNVRELRNVLERAIVAAEGEVIRTEHLPAEIGGEAAASSAATGSGSYQELKLEAERRIVVAALERHDWHVTRTAEALGLADHASLLKIMRRLEVRRE